MNEEHRATARGIASRYLEMGDPLGWFEALYSQADEEPSIIPWAEFEPNPNLVDWLDRHRSHHAGLALKIGSGLGDDAEELSRRGFETTAFDVSRTAVAWSKRRFLDSAVSYAVADLLNAPDEWSGRFDFVLESYTLQVLPPELRTEAIGCIVSFVAPGGTLLVIARGREPAEPKGSMPWPLTRKELTTFENLGMEKVSFEDYMDDEDPPVRRFRVTYRKGGN